MTDRFAWAAQILDPRPTDHLLEIGCGHGTILVLICPVLTTGHLTAIDRSEIMIREAAKENAECVASGKLTLINTEIAALDHPEASFDTIFAFNVNVFWLKPEREIAAIRRLIAPDGKLYLFFQPPSSRDPQSIIDGTSANLTASGFTIREAFTEQADAFRRVCVIASL